MGSIKIVRLSNGESLIEQRGIHDPGCSLPPGHLLEGESGPG